jgi:hypothetical protein
MTVSKGREVARLWTLALGLSALMVAAGQHWPQPLPIRPGLALALVLLPPLAMALQLLGRWNLPDDGEGGAPHHAAESVGPAREQH